MLLQHEAEAGLRSERAVVLTQRGAWRAAADDCGRVAALALLCDRPNEAAQAYSQQGALLALDADCWAESAESYTQAAHLYTTLDEHATAAQAWRQVAGFYITQQIEKRHQKLINKRFSAKQSRAHDRLQ